MKNTTNKQRDAGYQARQIRRLVVKPLARLIINRSAALHKTGRKCSIKINNVAHMIEMIARQMARDLMERK